MSVCLLSGEVAKDSFHLHVTPERSTLEARPSTFSFSKARGVALKHRDSAGTIGRVDRCRKGTNMVLICEMVVVGQQRCSSWRQFVAAYWRVREGSRKGEDRARSGDWRRRVRGQFSISARCAGPLWSSKVPKVRLK